MSGKIDFTELRMWLRTHRAEADTATGADGNATGSPPGGQSGGEGASAGAQQSPDGSKGAGQDRPQILNSVLAKQVAAANQSLISANANVRKLYEQRFAVPSPPSQSFRRSPRSPGAVYGSRMQG